MNWTQSFQSFGGTKIIVDKFAYTEKRVWRAVAIVTDKNRPNKVKPIYKRKLFIERKPCAYMVKGVGLIVHPEIYAAIQNRMRKSAEEQQRKMITSIFGLSEVPPLPSSLSVSDLKDLMKKYRL